MQTQFRRQAWGYDSNYIRVEALDDQGLPLGYVYFLPRVRRSLNPARTEQVFAGTFAAVIRRLVAGLLPGTLQAN
jgi:hypothetical protein